MLAYKTQLEINDEMLLLKIPSDFKGKRVEVIVLETGYSVNEENTNETFENLSFYNSFMVKVENETANLSYSSPNDFQKFLLTSPTWTDDEYCKFRDTRKLFNQWIID